MQYFATVCSIARSAAATLIEIDDYTRCRACRLTRFTGRVVAALTSRRAARIYRTIWDLMVIAMMVAIAVGMSTRDLLRALHAWCESCLDTPQPLLPAAPAPIALLSAASDAREDDPWDLDAPATPIALPLRSLPQPLLPAAPAPVGLLPAAPAPKAASRKKAAAKPKKPAASKSKRRKVA